MLVAGVFIIVVVQQSWRSVSARTEFYGLCPILGKIALRHRRTREGCMQQALHETREPGRCRLLARVAIGAAAQSRS